MKISYSHIAECINPKPSIEDISKNLFQLGHEHEICNGVFDLEITPNRGDCLSLNGILKDLALFYEIDINRPIYKKSINKLNLDFINNAKKDCSAISFIKIEVDEVVDFYSDQLENYFNDLEISKNNFFTDISNYISYETGQPTHCYDQKKLGTSLSLNMIEGSYDFESLIDKKIRLEGKNLVFNRDNEIINLAGVMGGNNTSCSKKTKSVIVECAYFNPEAIIGKSTKYDIKSDAAYKFERGVDPNCHDMVIRRFIKLVEDHTNLINIEMVSWNYDKSKPNKISTDVGEINSILGTNIFESNYREILEKLGFEYNNNLISVPSYRSDVETSNDIAEEIARSVGYDNIEAQEFNIHQKSYDTPNKIEKNIKSLLIDNGFYEVINNSFTDENTKYSIAVDNPLDSNKNFLRTNLKKSLIANLLYNERRQKDSVKLFELSDVYCLGSNMKRVIGIIASGRIGKDYLDFSKKINNGYLKGLLSKYLKDDFLKIETISRQDLDSKLKDTIAYFEFEINLLHSKILDYIPAYGYPDNFIKYEQISEYPSSKRDLSFSIGNFSHAKSLEKILFDYDHDILKEVFLFDYYKNDKLKQIKKAYRFIFQSKKETVTDKDIDKIMNDIIRLCLEVESISIPGLKQ